MSHVVIDRVKETASTTGTGSFTLAGAVAGFKTFASRLATNDTTWYCAVNGTDWEIGLGTLSASTTLARTTVLASSNADALVNFSTAPAVFGTMPGAKLSAAGGPAFSVYLTADQTVTTGATTKVAFNAAKFNLGACFDITTNRRFTPNVPGYYQFNWVSLEHTTGTISAGGSASYLYKNGVAEVVGTYGLTAIADNRNPGSALVYLNGTTDYVEMFVYAAGTGTLTLTSGIQTVLFGYLARPA